MVSPAGRSALFGLPPEFGRTFAVQDFVAHAANQLREMSELRFPPAWRVCHISGAPELVIEAAEQAVQFGAEVVSRNSAAEVLLRFRYQDGFKVSDALKAVAIRSSLGGSSAGKRRLKIAMDELAEL